LALAAVSCIFSSGGNEVKLYSRIQVALYSAFSALGVLLLALLVARFLYSGPVEEPGRPGALPEEAPPGLPVQFEPTPAVSAGDLSEDELNNIRVYERLNEAVVNVTSVTFEYNWFLEPTPREGTGSGSIIDRQGHVLTNYHVIKDAEQLTVTLADGQQYEGLVVGMDPENDLAVIEFDPQGRGLTVIPFGRSDALRVGQKVLAIGNPFALERTLTTGIVSGLGRPVKTESGLVIREMIQTDASINPGNSGGPLLNPRGELIGVNTMIYSPSGGSVGIGFAVPVDTARRVVPDLIRYGRVQRGWIDITPVQIFPALVQYARLPVKQGVLVSEVTPSSPAEKAGLRGGSPSQAVRYGRSIIYLGGDIIVEVDRMPVTSLYDLLGALEDNKPGEKVEVKVLRGKERKSLFMPLSERPSSIEW
jgi:S1-C subfamily serine protease